jgi:hypothetical protein
MTILISLFVTVVLVAACSFVAYLVGARMKERYSEDRQNVGYRSAARVERERKVPLGQIIEDMPRSAKLVIAGVVVLSAALVVVTNADARQGIANGWSWLWEGDRGTDPAIAITVGDDNGSTAPSESPELTGADLQRQSGTLYQVVPPNCRGMYARDNGDVYGTVLAPGSYFSPLTHVRVVDCTARTVSGWFSTQSSDGAYVTGLYTVTDLAVACDDDSVIQTFSQLAGTSLGVVGPSWFNEELIGPDVKDLLGPRLTGRSVADLYDHRDEVVAELNVAAEQVTLGYPNFTFGSLRVTGLQFPERGSNE